MAAGIGLGIVIASALTRFLQGFVYDVGTTDAATFIGAGALLSLVALGAMYLPASRATRVDPVKVLRES